MQISLRWFSTLQLSAKTNRNCCLGCTLPPKGNLVLAQQLLMSLNALTPDHDAHALSGSITAEGSRMAQLPCHPRIAKMMISSGSPSSQALACDIAALLEEKDPMGENEDSDMTLRLSILRSARSKKNLGRWNRIAQIAQEYRKMLRIREDNEPIDAEEVGHLIALAYPERIAHATDHAGNFKMSNGNTIFIDPMRQHGSKRMACHRITQPRFNLIIQFRAGTERKSISLSPRQLEELAGTNLREYFMGQQSAGSKDATGNTDRSTRHRQQADTECQPRDCF